MAPLSLWPPLLSTSEIVTTSFSTGLDGFAGCGLNVTTRATTTKTAAIVKKTQVSHDVDSDSSFALPSSCISTTQPVAETFSPAEVEGHMSFKLFTPSASSSS